MLVTPLVLIQIFSKRMLVDSVKVWRVGIIQNLGDVGRFVVSDSNVPVDRTKKRVCQNAGLTLEMRVTWHVCWDSNRAYLLMEQLFCWRFAHITTLEVVPVALEGSDDPCSKSDSSKFTDGLNMWPAVMCGLSGALFLSQLQSWKQVDAYNYLHSGQFFEKVIVACSVGAQSCFIPGSIHRHWHSGSRRYL